MKPRLPALLLVLLASCSGPDNNRAQGYIEGDYLYIAPQVPGRITTLAVAEGAWADKGALAFTLDDTEAKAKLAQAKATLKDAEAEFHRQQNLRTKRVSSQADLDSAQMRFDSAQASVDQARWQLEQCTVYAPVSGVVADIYFRQGEVVAASRPVLSLLPPTNKKVRFFVPETRLALLPLGATVEVNCDACKPGLKARVTFVASEAEFTPPVIFSRETRAKFVFKVEAALLDDAQALKVGQPVDVSLPQP